MAVIEPGKKAPAFSLKDQAGQTHKLSDYAGQPLILYFYPKDDTPGCTKEAWLTILRRGSSSCPRPIARAASCSPTYRTS